MIKFKSALSILATNVAAQDCVTGTSLIKNFSTFSFAPITLHNRTQQHFDIAPPPHVQQPLIKTVVSALRNEGRCPSTGQSAARTNYVMEQIVYGR